MIVNHYFCKTLLKPSVRRSDRVLGYAESLHQKHFRTYSRQPLFTDMFVRHPCETQETLKFDAFWRSLTTVCNQRFCNTLFCAEHFSYLCLLFPLTLQASPPSKRGDWTTNPNSFSFGFLQFPRPWSTAPWIPVAGHILWKSCKLLVKNWRFLLVKSLLVQFSAEWSSEELYPPTYKRKGGKALLTFHIFPWLSDRWDADVQLWWESDWGNHPRIISLNAGVSWSSHGCPKWMIYNGPSYDEDETG